MSEADIATLRAGYEATNRGDWEAAFRGRILDFERRRTTAFLEDQREPFEEVVLESQ